MIPCRGCDMDRPTSPLRCARVKSFADVVSLTVPPKVAGLPDCRVTMRRHPRPEEDQRMRKYLKFSIDGHRVDPAEPRAMGGEFGFRDYLEIKGIVGYGPRSCAD